MQILQMIGLLSLSLFVTVGAPSTLWLQGGPSVSVIARSAPDRIDILKNGTRGDVDRRMIKVALREGEHERLVNVLMLLDPADGAHWWFFQYTSDRGDNFEKVRFPFVVYFTEDRAVGFGFAHTLGVREVMGRHHSFDAMEKAVLASLLANIKAVRAGNGSAYVVEVDVNSRLGDFLTRRDSAAVPPPPDIVGLSLDKGVWRVVLRGPNRDFAEVILDSRYAVKGVSRIQGPLRPHGEK